METLKMYALEIFTVSLIVGISAVLIFGVMHRERVEMPKAYAAWVKQTGNGKGLTYEEWRSLIRAQDKRDTGIILMPLPR